MATRAGQVLNRDLDLYAQFWDIVHEGKEVPPIELKQPGGFLVLNNVPGYMPEDDDPPVFDTQAEAWAYLCEEVQRYIEHEDADEQITVSTYPEFGYAEVGDSSLGRIFYINGPEHDDA